MPSLRRLAGCADGFRHVVMLLPLLLGGVWLGGGGEGGGKSWADSFLTSAFARWAFAFSLLSFFSR